jgi:DME family drug/metabolite transporter
MRRLPRVVVVALAAAMWGTDPIIRKPLSYSTSATTIVFGEHVVLVLLTFPLLYGAFRAVMRAGRRAVGCAVVISVQRRRRVVEVPRRDTAFAPA